jgi:hypothetical protein
VGYVARKARDAYRVIVAKPNRKKPLRRSRRGWKNNIKIFLKKWGGGISWIYLAQVRDRWRPDLCVGMKFQAY